MTKDFWCVGLFMPGMVLIALPSFAQFPAVTDSQLLAKYYEQAMSIQSGLINGRDYLGYESVEGEHPYFGENDWATGSVTYDGIFYDDVELRYDLENDLLICEHPFNGQMMQLVSTKVNSFQLRDHYFEFFDKKLGLYSFQGFYDVIYGGRSKAMVKRTKTFHKRYSASVYDPTYPEKNAYFLIVKNVPFRINSMTDLVRALGEHGMEAKKAVRKQRLSFKRDPDRTIRAMAEYFDSHSR